MRLRVPGRGLSSAGGSKPDTGAKEQNDRIEAQLKKDKLMLRSVGGFGVLADYSGMRSRCCSCVEEQLDASDGQLGAGESGKSTVLKQSAPIDVQPH